MKNKQSKEPIIKTRKKLNNAIEVEVKKNPAKTPFGKIIIILILIGMVGISIISLIFLLIEALNF